MLCAAVSGLWGQTALQPTLPGPLHVEGKWVKNAEGNPVTLRGVALADLDAIHKGDRSQKVPTTAFTIMDKALEEGWYVDVFRLTVHPEVGDETGIHGWLHYDPEEYFTTILDPVVQYALSKGKYVIIDWHYVGVRWEDRQVAENTQRFWLGSGAWKGIAEKYAGTPGVIFELFNEPGEGAWAEWKPYAEAWVRGIRAKGADNLVIVGGPRWSQIMPRKQAELINEPNVVYACHIYPLHTQYMMPDWIEYVSSVAPVIMTEWGFEKDAPNPVNGTASGYGKRFKAYIDSKPNVGWVAWCFDSVYRPVMFDMRWTLLGNGRSTPQMRFSGGALDTADNYMGQFVKTWLAEHAKAAR